MGAETIAEKYSEDALPTYTPMPWYALLLFSSLLFPSYSLTFSRLDRSLKEIRAAIPQEFFVRSARRGLLALARSVSFMVTGWWFATRIDPFFKQSVVRETLTPVGTEAARWAAWGV